MLKKAVIFIMTICFLLMLSTNVLATNNNGVVGNIVNDAKNTISNGATNIRDTFNDGANNLRNTTENIGNTTMNGMNAVGNTITNTTNTVANDVADTSNTAGYTATRTAQNTDGMMSNTWMWIIIAIAAVVIIGAIWFYATQSNDRD